MLRFRRQVDMTTPNTIIADLVAEIDALRKERDELLSDKYRLDFLDGNERFKMGWYVGAAPVGNLLVSSVIQLNRKITSIREAIDAAISHAEGYAKC